MPPSDAAVEGVSGAIGGIVATVATYPLIKMNTLQAIRGRVDAPGRDVEGGAGSSGGPSLGGGTLHELKELVRSGGWHSLFSGIEASLIGTTASQGIYFYLYSLLRRLAVLRRAAAEAAVTGRRRVLSEVDIRSANVTVAESLLMAALAGVGNVLLTNPIWMVATRMQAQSRATKRAAATDGALTVAPCQKNILAVTRHVYSEYGLAGFWNGTAASLVMVVNPTLQYALYEWLQAARAKFRRAGNSGKHVRASALEVFLLSSVAKAGATLLTYPMINIKTRMYTATKGAGGGDGGHHSSIPRAAAEILRNEGLAGYYQGLCTKIVQSVLAAALLFVAKEKITDLARDLLEAAARGSSNGLQQRHTTKST